ncbi:MAG: hypothetical protein HQL54_04505 [Magnetococcales bacterium]|nr:hypothetical protein [Magnetococcales bacterium]
MGQLVQQTLPTLFQGVSRQPDAIRLAGQVEEGINALFSVVTGGFEKRAGSSFVNTLDNIDPTADIAIFSYARDLNEQYIIAVQNGDLLVYGIDGLSRSITFDDGKNYLMGTPELDFAMVTVLDVTLIVNRTITVAMQPADSASVYGPVRTYGDLPREGNPVPDYLSVLDLNDDKLWDTDDSGCADGSIWKVEPPDGDRYGHYFVKLDRSGDVWTWLETVDPNYPNAFDPTTMPHMLVRESDGTFTFKQTDWDSREVGDPTLVPNPDFVGNTINDIVFFQNRIGLVSDETIFFSQAGSYFNFWPDKATDALDSDPFGLTASATSVNILRFVVPMRQELFASSLNNQFEISGTPFRAASASIKRATGYQASETCRPITQGDELYFAAQSGDHAVIYEYYYDDSSVSNVAGDITKHCMGYIPAPVIRMVGDTVSNTLFVLSGSARDTLFIYRMYWDGPNKAQSSWSKWVFEESWIHDITFLNNQLYLIIRDSDGVSMLTRMTMDHQKIQQNEPFTIRLDRKTAVTGSYDQTSNTTSWTLPYVHHNKAQAILSDLFPAGCPGKQLPLNYTNQTQVTTTGDFSAYPVTFGMPYDMDIILSEQYLRRGDSQRSLTSGRLQIRHMTLDYVDTYSFKIHITPAYRTTVTASFQGRMVGKGTNIIGSTPEAETGTFRTSVGCRGNQAKIQISNDTPYPSLITSAKWVGFYNDMGGMR